jgi:hypothetical protein
MNAANPREHEVLARTLDEVRRVRRRRAACKLAVLPLLLLLAAGWHALSRDPSATTSPPLVVVEAPRAVESAGESLTVVEWKGGMPSLVEYSGEELGKLELTLSLEPVVAFPEEVW